MKKEKVTKPVIKLLGISIMTNNANERDPQTAKIGPLVGRYFSQNIAANMPHRKNPGVTFSVYTNYESDEHGNYTYFIGEEVSLLDNAPAEFHTLIIPESQYQRFTTPAGKMPQVVIEAWQAIWQMAPTQLEGKRNYLADFELYDYRASDPNNTVVDIYVGIHNR